MPLWINKYDKFIKINKVIMKNTSGVNLTRIVKNMQKKITFYWII